MVHETTREVTISERKWRIRKFDALTGCYIAYQLMSQMLPGGMDKQVSGMGNLPEGRSMMPEKDFKELMKKCLSVCDEILPVGPVPVMRENGGWGVMDIENDMGIVLALTVNAIMFNVQGFFGGNALKDLTDSLPDMKSFAAKM